MRVRNRAHEVAGDYERRDAAYGVQIAEGIASGVLVVGGGANMGFARAMMKAWTPATSGAGGSDSPPDRFN